MYGAELARVYEVSLKYIQAITKKALDSGFDYISIKNDRYFFELKSKAKGRRAYFYSKVERASKKLVVSERNLNIELSEEQKDILEKKMIIVSMFATFKGSVNEFIEYIIKNVDENYSRKKHYDWQKLYKSGGARALVDTRGRKKGETVVLNSRQQEFLIKGFRAWAAGGINYTQLWEELHRSEATTLGFDFLEWKAGRVKNICDVKSVMRFIKNYYEKRVIEWTLITKGEDANKSLNQPAYGDRKEQYLAKNECWEIDSSPADVIVFEEGRQMRPDILAIKDCFSGRCVAMLCENSNSLALTRLLWRAISCFGVPKSIKTDNGKDYVSRQFSMLLSNLGIKQVRATAYAGDEKGAVERNFRTIQHSYISILSGFIGHNLDKRQKIEQQVAKKDRKSKDEFGNAVKTQIASSELLSLSLLEEKLQEAVLLWEIDKKRRKTKSPIELWNSCLEPVYSMDYENFLMYAGGFESRKVQKNGIAYDGRRYESRFIHKYRGQEVYVVENIDDISQVFVFDKEGEFIGKCVDSELKAMKKEDFIAMKKEFNKDVKAYQTAIKDDRSSLRSKIALRDDLRNIKEYHEEKLKRNKVVHLENESFQKNKEVLPKFDDMSVVVVDVAEKTSKKSLYADYVLNVD